MLSQAAVIFGNVLLPILLIVALGALVQRFHPLHLATLSKLQIYLFVPVFLFVRVTASTLSWAEIAGIAGAVLLAKALLAVPLALVLRRLEVPRETLGVVVLSSAIFNAGNFGIPVAERAFGTAGGAVQALVVMVSNLTLWGIGYGALAALSGQSRRAALAAYFKLPMVYLLVLAFTLRGAHLRLPSPVEYALGLIADGLVPIALVTLGAQLAQQARWPRWRIIVPVLALKLLALPAITAGVVVALGLWPWPGAMLIVASAGPTAVNTLLMAIEQNGDAELAADCVFWTTLLSAVTVTLVLGIVVALGGQPPGGAATAAP
jgi:hypothetical protein